MSDLEGRCDECGGGLRPVMRPRRPYDPALGAVGCLLGALGGLLVLGFGALAFGVLGLLLGALGWQPPEVNRVCTSCGRVVVAPWDRFRRVLPALAVLAAGAILLGAYGYRRSRQRAARRERAGVVPAPTEGIPSAETAGGAARPAPAESTGEGEGEGPGRRPDSEESGKQDEGQNDEPEDGQGGPPPLPNDTMAWASGLSPAELERQFEELPKRIAASERYADSLEEAKYRDLAALQRARAHVLRQDYEAVKRVRAARRADAEKQ
jgi:hypothetical protein